MLFNRTFKILLINILVILNCFSSGSSDNEENNRNAIEVELQNNCRNSGSKQNPAEIVKQQLTDSNPQTDQSESKRKKFSKLKIAGSAITLFSAATILAYKKDERAKKKINTALQKSQDYIICNILCPVLIKWEELKEEPFTKKDGAIVLLCSGASIGAYLLYKKFR